MKKNILTTELISLILFSMFSMNLMAEDNNNNYFLNLKANNVIIKTELEGQTPPPVEDNRLSLSETIAKANSQGSAGAGIAGYSFGTFWVANDYIAGSKYDDIPSSNTAYIHVTNNGNIIVYSDFRDNPFTTSTNNGPKKMYINGVNVIEAGKTIANFIGQLGEDAVRDYYWNENASSYYVNGTWYKFNNPDFPLDSQFKQ